VHDYKMLMFSHYLYFHLIMTEAFSRNLGQFSMLKVAYQRTLIFHIIYGKSEFRYYTELEVFIMQTPAHCHIAHDIKTEQ